MNQSNSNSPLKGSALVWILGAGVLIILGGILIGSVLTPLIFPPTYEASTQAQEVDQLFRFLLMVGGAVFLLVEGMIIFSVIRFRAKPGDTSDGLHIHGNRTLEFVWTLIPAATVTVLAVYSFQVFNSTRAEQPNEQTIHVTGERFKWSFEYQFLASLLPSGTDPASLPPNVQADLNDDGLMSITVADMYAFVGENIITEMEAKDVIHSFWIPAMRIKQDLLPGRVTEVRFTPTTPSSSDAADGYRIVCAELCGGGHGTMGLQSHLVVYSTEQEYNTWVAGVIDKYIHPPADPVARGRALLNGDLGVSYPCSGCHTLSDLGWTGNVGPNLDNVGDRSETLRQASTGLVPEDYFHQSLRQPQAFIVPGFGPVMPIFTSTAGDKYYMPDTDMYAIIAYLCTQTSSGQPACTVDPSLIGAGGPAAEATGEATAEATGEATAAATDSAATAEATASS